MIVIYWCTQKRIKIFNALVFRRFFVVGGCFDGDVLALWRGQAHVCPCLTMLIPEHAASLRLAAGIRTCLFVSFGHIHCVDNVAVFH